MKEVQYLSKDDKIQFKTTNYKAISEEKVTTTVRESLIKHGIAIVPVEQEHSREGTLSTVDVSYRIQNIDDIEDYVIAKSSGTGADTQDKGVGKAMTYAYKYLLLRTFAIPTGEDPDKISSDELDAKEKESTNNKAEGKPTISEPQAKRMFAIAGNPKLVQDLLTAKGYAKSTDVKVSEYEAICKELEKKGAK